MPLRVFGLQVQPDGSERKIQEIEEREIGEGDLLSRIKKIFHWGPDGREHIKEEMAVEKADSKPSFDRVASTEDFLSEQRAFWDARPDPKIVVFEGQQDPSVNTTPETHTPSSSDSDKKGKKDKKKKGKDKEMVESSAEPSTRVISEKEKKAEMKKSDSLERASREGSESPSLVSRVVSKIFQKKDKAEDGDSDAETAAVASTTVTTIIETKHREKSPEPKGSLRDSRTKERSKSPGPEEKSDLERMKLTAEFLQGEQLFWAARPDPDQPITKIVKKSKKENRRSESPESPAELSPRQSSEEPSSRKSSEGPSSRKSSPDYEQKGDKEKKKEKKSRKSGSHVSKEPVPLVEVQETAFIKVHVGEKDDISRASELTTRSVTPSETITSGSLASEVAPEALIFEKCIKFKSDSVGDLSEPSLESASAPAVPSSSTSVITETTSTTYITKIIRIIRKVRTPDGKLSVSEELREISSDLSSGERVPSVERTKKVINVVVSPDGQQEITEEEEVPDDAVEDHPSVFSRIVKKTKTIFGKDHSATHSGESAPSSPEKKSKKSKKEDKRVPRPDSSDVQSFLDNERRIDPVGHKQSKGTSPLSPVTGTADQGIKTVEVALSLDDKSLIIGQSHIDSDIRFEKAQGPLDVTKKDVAVTLPAAREGSYVLPTAPSLSASVDEPPSIASSVAESVDISMPADSSSADTPRPTDEGILHGPPTPSSTTDEKGYDPEDRTTVDDVSLTDDSATKLKRKSKKKQKIAKGDKSETLSPKSSAKSASPEDASLTSSHPIVSPLHSRSPDSLESSVHSMPLSTDEIIRVVEEGVPSRPSSGEAGVLVTKSVTTTVSVFERVVTADEGIQTSSPDHPKSPVHTSAQTLQPESMTKESQTSPTPTQPKSPVDVKPTTAEAHMQTAELPTRDSSIQTTERKTVTEISVQTVDTASRKASPDKKPLIQTGESATQAGGPRESQSVQTSPAPPKTDFAHQAGVPTSEEGMQTSKTASPDTPARPDSSVSSPSSGPFDVIVQTSVSFDDGRQPVKTETVRQMKGVTRTDSSDCEAAILASVSVDFGDVPASGARTSTEAFLEGERSRQIPPTPSVDLQARSDDIREKLRQNQVVRGDPAQRPGVLQLAARKLDGPSQAALATPQHCIQEVEKKLKNINAAMKQGDTQQTEELIFTTIETITTWLETIEYRILVIREKVIRF